MARRVIVALSGGVDSAVTALLARRAGHEVQGLYMSNWEEDEQGYCSAAQDFQDARAVAHELGIPLHHVDLSRQYRERVFAHFLAESQAGRTPNPDVLCNREIKFGDCLGHALRLGADHLATGHYARLVQAADGPELHKGVDAGKDQSYFLHDVPREKFRRVLLPLGERHKDEVRALAREAGLPVHAKRDSTGICFIGERPFREFLAHHLAPRPGPIVDENGVRLGEHMGLAFYTLGQRGGLGIGGRADGDGEAWYVAAKDAQRNALVVVQGARHPLLFSRGADITRCNWLCAPPDAAFAATVRLRYRQADQAAQVVPLAENAWRVRTTEPQRAVTPGQYAVLYRGTRCLGGGVVERTVI